MGKLSHTDKHSPIVQTGQPNLEQPKPTLEAPQKPKWAGDAGKTEPGQPSREHPPIQQTPKKDPEREEGKRVDRKSGTR